VPWQTFDVTVFDFKNNSAVHATSYSPPGASQSYLELIDILGLGWKELVALVQFYFLQTVNF